MPLCYEIPPVAQVSDGSGLAPGDTREAALLVLEERQLGAGDHSPTFTLAKKGGQLTLDCSDMEEGGPGANWTRHYPGHRQFFCNHVSTNYIFITFQLVPGSTTCP